MFYCSKNGTQNKVVVKEWLTVEEVANYFSTKPKTVRKWLYERKLRYYKVGGLVRIHKNDLGKFPVRVPTKDDLMSNVDFN